MLILTRKPGEEICIGPDIRVRVLEIRGSQVRIGISAPKGIQVHRSEVYARILEENRAASQSTRQQVDRVALLWRRLQGKPDRSGGMP